MASTFVVSRTHLIYGVCIPLAILVGYFLALPLESGGLAVIVLLFSVLSIPILMRWHHPLLIFSCNAAFMMPEFIPGRPNLWMVMAVLSLFFSVVNRSLESGVNFFRARSVSRSLIFFAIVVLVTAYFTGGITFRSLGASSYGGKKYFSIATAIILYFALSTPAVPPKRTGLAVGLFFISTFTWLAGYIAVAGGPAFYFLSDFLPIEGVVNAAYSMESVIPSGGMARLGSGLLVTSLGVFCYIMARYGLGGLLDLSKPWRLALLVLTLVAALASGYRSSLITMVLGMGVMFYLENLHRTKYLLVFGLMAVLSVSLLVPYARVLPLAMQRSLSIFPLDIDPMAREDAQGSTTWRLDMWKRILPEVPTYLVLGKGYSLSGDELFMVSAAVYRGYSVSSEGAALAGDYHSGPLSLIIPFGIAGVAGFTWFLAASLRVLNRNRLYGEPSLNNVNTFLFAFFIVRIISYIFVFGSLYSDMVQFSGLIGLSVCLNGGVAQPPSQEEIEEEEAEAA
jgi:hypothetical protein